ncbi:MAG: symmetrical bis(5'-nucleosyl)-tetraphosphatase [Gammaproteobacteria bacterium]|nr:symmetrical bis(5'-nucleosyl)-tetraphosphatase [Gammaproteobacteria bacterium]
MARIAVGDVQGCLPELRQLLKQVNFRSDRDEVWFVGDLVNRGPDSLGTLRFVRALGDNARVVLGNHDLHLLAVATSSSRRLRVDDTLDDILSAIDREALLEWLITRPLAVKKGSDLMVHAGVVPQWSAEDVMGLAAEVEQALRADPAKLFESMYGNRPDRWTVTLEGFDRLWFIINVLTRLRYCSADGRIDLKMKVAPGSQERGWIPWFEAPERRTSGIRVISGHWSTLGLVDRPDLLTLDTGGVWGGALTAAALDSTARWSLPCRGYKRVKMSVSSD